MPEESPMNACACRAAAVWLLVPLLYLASSVATATVKLPGADQARAVVAGEIQRTLVFLSLGADERPANFDALSEIYRSREFRPLWSDDTGVTSAAHYWLAVLADAGQQGMEGARQMREALERRLSPGNAAQFAELDIMLSDSFLQLAGTLAHGQVGQLNASPAQGAGEGRVQAVKLIEQAAAGGQPSDAYRALLPSHPNYRALRSMLMRYLWIQESGGWPRIDPRGQALKPGDVHADIPRVRDILRSLGDLKGEASADETFDEALALAVQRFQRRHGLNGDGVIGARTRAELAVDVDQRVRQIQLNLERWRWLPRELGDRYILVNTAGFQLQAYSHERLALSMRVIVGRTSRQTPVFTERLRYLVVNPYWRVPDKIARRDLIPAIQDDPGYFFERGIRVLSGWRNDSVELDPLAVDWDAALAEPHLPYKLQQDPGPRNALGRIKFMMPNRYSVYLHDTPGRHLFKRQVRTFSSGCIRLEQPLALADFLLADAAQSDRPPPDLETLIASEQTHTLTLPEPVPVYTVYQTAWVDAEGTLQLRRDIYRRDRRLAAQLNAEPASNASPTPGRKPSLAHLLDTLP